LIIIPDREHDVASAVERQAGTILGWATGPFRNLAADEIAETDWRGSDETIQKSDIDALPSPVRSLATARMADEA
jgi:hypothetical protein